MHHGQLAMDVAAAVPAHHSGVDQNVTTFAERIFDVMIPEDVILMIHVREVTIDFRTW